MKLTIFPFWGSQSAALGKKIPDRLNSGKDTYVSRLSFFVIKYLTKKKKPHRAVRLPII